MLDTILVEDSLTAPEKVAVQDTLAAQDTLVEPAVAAAVDALLVRDTVAVLDSPAAPEPSAAPTALIGRLYHAPPAKGILNDRPFQFYLFVNVDSSQVLNVSLNLKND